MRHSADDFQHDLPSGRFSDAPVYDRRLFQRNDAHASDGGFDPVSYTHLVEIVAKGIMLYDSGECQLATPGELDYAEIKKMAENLSP